MMLSNRMTAKSRELNPARQARKRMLNDSKDCHPAGCVSPPDRPPLPPPPPPPPAAPGRLFPCTEPPELADALCLPSLAAWCSAISARGVGWIFLGRPCYRAPVSPSAPLVRVRFPQEFSRASPPSVRTFQSRDATPRKRRRVPKRTLMRHTLSPRLSTRFAVERRRKWAGRVRWAWRRKAPAACHRSTGTRRRGSKYFSQSKSFSG